VLGVEEGGMRKKYLKKDHVCRTGERGFWESLTLITTWGSCVHIGVKVN
jgi:hypothetical protein